jgi:diaminopimelate decarboxylase
MLMQRLRLFDRAFGRIPHTICYAVKANSNLTLLRMLARQGCGFDVVSGGELERVRLASPAAVKRTVFSGVGKTREEIEAAIRAGIFLFNVESEEELDLLAACAARRRKTVRIGLRVNPEVSAQTHAYISTGLRKHKFGIPIEQARKLYPRAAASPYLDVAGVSVHIGSQIMDVAPFGVALQRVASLVKELRSEGHNIRYVDAGGGLGIDYEKASPLGFADYVARYAKKILQPLRGLKVHLLLEPGRVLVGPAGVLLTSVLYVKDNEGKRFTIVDAAMNDLLRPSLYGAYHEIVPVVAQKKSGTNVTDVVGPVCESGDFLARDRELPAVSAGDLLAVLDAGAYGTVLASNYNTRPRPAEVLVHGKKVQLVRRRETLGDLVRSETTRRH